MREQFLPTSAINAMGLGQSVALITDGRFSAPRKARDLIKVLLDIAVDPGIIALATRGDDLMHCDRRVYQPICGVGVSP